MANRYWVGGTASWDGTAGTKWSTTDGGAGGAAVPTSADDVFFTAASGASTVTIATGNTGAKSITCTGFTGTLAGSASISVSGSVLLVAGMTVTYSGILSMIATGTLTTAGKTLVNVTTSVAGITVTLGDALTLTGSLTVTRGTFTTNNYAITASSFASTNSNTRTINLGSSAIALSSTGAAFDFTTTTGLTFNPGTSTISITGSSATFNGGGKTFATVNFTSTSSVTRAITGANTFGSLGFNGRSSAGIGEVTFSADQTVTGTFTIAPGAGASARTFYRSNTVGTARTITAGTFASGSAHTDFRDIVAGGASFTGTGFGDCKGNTGITFPAAKTVYWNSGFTSNWAGSAPVFPAWATTLGGSPDFANFPLAQDTAVFGSSSPASGGTITISSGYNIGTIDMSARTSNTMTLATGSQNCNIFGNWINGTGTTLTGTGILYWQGRTAQTITSAGKTFPQVMRIESPGGSITLADAFTYSNNTSAFLLTTGTFDLAGYAFTLTGASSGTFNLSGTGTRSLQIGSSTITIAASGNAFNAGTSTNLTVTGTGTVSLTSASAKTFAGGGIQTYPTVNQGGTGSLTISGSNKFADITNTAIGRVQFTGGTTNEFTAFNLNGTSTAARLALGSTNTTQVTLKAPSWNVGTGSLDSGNNTGLSFTAGTVDFLDISYVIGVAVGAAYVITANNGTYAVAGQTASILRSRIVTAAAGAYTTTGFSIEFSKGVTLNADAGAYAVTGFAAQILRSRAVNASAGTYTTTGFDIQFSKGITLNADAGAYITTGFDAQILKTRVLNADNGYYNVTGYPATIVVGGGPPIIVTDQLLIKLRSFTETRRF
jgi:hypothetical protein